jgi:hypothetical protein
MYVRETMPEYTPESTPTHLPWALGNPMPEPTLTQRQSRPYPHSQGLCICPQGICADL